MRRRSKAHPLKAFFVLVPLAIMLFWSLAPIYWIIVTRSRPTRSSIAPC